MIHQPLGGAQGQATDIQIQAKEILRLREIGNDILVKHTGQPLEKFKLILERDFFMSSEQAKNTDHRCSYCPWGKSRKPEIER